MAVNFLTVLQTKTGVLVFRPSKACVDPFTETCSLKSYCYTSARNLDVLLNSNFKPDKQINPVGKVTFFFYLRLLSKVKPFITKKDLVNFIHTFISCWFDRWCWRGLDCTVPIGPKCC